MLFPLVGGTMVCMETKKQQSNWRGGLLVLAAGILWGTIGTFVKVLESCGSNATLSAFFRVGFACLCLAAMTVARGGFASLRVSKRTLLFAAAIGVICQGMFNLFYSISITRTGVSTAAALLTVAPVFSAIGGRIAYRERFGIGKVLALVLNVVGSVLAVTGGHFGDLSLDLLGLLAGLGAGTCFALTSLLARQVAEDVDPFVISTYTFFFASVFLLLFTKPFTGVTFTAPLLFWGLMIGLVPTAVASIFYYRGVARISEPSRVPIFASAEPVIGTLLGVCLFREALGIVNVLGLAVVIVSIVLIGRAK